MDPIMRCGILCLIVLVVYTTYQIISCVLWLREENKKTAQLIKEIVEAQLENVLRQEERHPCDTCLHWPECNGVDADTCLVRIHNQRREPGDKDTAETLPE